MLARNEVIFKWTLYGAAAVLCLLVQEALLQRITLWGVIPFIYPLVAVIPATLERPVAGTIFALCVGVVCDLLLPEVFPCFYTLIFPLAGLCAALLSQSVLRASFLCSLVASVIAFLMTGLFHGFLLWVGGKTAWGSAAFVTVREMLFSLPLIFPVTVLFRAVYAKAHKND